MNFENGRMTFKVDELEQLKKIFDLSSCDDVDCEGICCKLCVFGNIRDILENKYRLTNGSFCIKEE